MEFRHTLPAINVIFGRGTRKTAGKETAKWGKKALVVAGKIYQMTEDTFTYKGHNVKVNPVSANGEQVKKVFLKAF